MDKSRVFCTHCGKEVTEEGFCVFEYEVYCENCFYIVRDGIDENNALFGVSDSDFLTRR